jgi:hypothetical protein
MSQKDTSAQGSAGQHEKFSTDVRIMLQCDGGREGVAGGQQSKIYAVNTQTSDYVGRYKMKCVLDCRVQNLP